jgi:hypothetical protein
MSLQVSVYQVARIEVSANGAPLSDGSQTMCWWQELQLFDGSDALIGRVVLHLKSPDVALPVGDQPPYWGVDPISANLTAPLTHL